MTNSAVCHITITLLSGELIINSYSQLLRRVARIRNQRMFVDPVCTEHTHLHRKIANDFIFEMSLINIQPDNFRKIIYILERSRLSKVVLSR